MYTHLTQVREAPSASEERSLGSQPKLSAQDVFHLEVHWTAGASLQGHVKMLPSGTRPENKAQSKR